MAQEIRVWVKAEVVCGLSTCTSPTPSTIPATRRFPKVGKDNEFMKIDESGEFPPFKELPGMKQEILICELVLSWRKALEVVRIWSIHFSCSFQIYRVGHSQDQKSPRVHVSRTLCSLAGQLGRAATVIMSPKA